jgi:hypothetical protein
MSGAPPDYAPLHLYAHSWLLTGPDNFEENGQGNWEFSAPETMGGLIAQVSTLQATPSPYAAALPSKDVQDVYDPMAAGEPFSTAPPTLATALNAAEPSATVDSTWDTMYDQIMLALPVDDSEDHFSNFYAALKANLPEEAWHDWDTAYTALLGKVPLTPSGYGWDTAYDTIMAAVSTIDQSTDWTSFYSALSSALDTDFIAAQKAALLADLNTVFLKDAERLMAVFNGLDLFDSTTFWAALALLKNDKDKELNRYLAELKLKAHEALMNIATQLTQMKDQFRTNAVNVAAGVDQVEKGHAAAYMSTASDLARTNQESLSTALTVAADMVKAYMAKQQAVVSIAAELSKSDLLRQQLYLQHFEMALKMTELYTHARRQEIEDILKLKVEDRLWEIKAYEHLGKGLGAIGGAQVIPGTPNPILETLSGVGSILGPGLGFLARVL